MDEYSIVDKRKYPFLILDKSIPLAYAPYIGTGSVCLYLIYASLADHGVVSIQTDEITEFIGIDEESLKEFNKILEEYGLIKLEAHEHNGKIVNTCYVLQPPPFPRTLYADLRKKALVKDIVEDVINLVSEEATAQAKKTRTPLITTTKLITKFYSMMGNGKVDIFEREAGKKHINELLKKGYSLEDIDFAIEWGFGHAKNEIDDLSSIGNLITRAIKAKDEHIAQISQQAEDEAKNQENEEIERKMVEAYRKFMPDSEIKSLRERVIESIRQDKRIKEEFVTEQFILIKENEIIREEYLKRGNS